MSLGVHFIDGFRAEAKFTQLLCKTILHLLLHYFSIIFFGIYFYIYYQHNALLCWNPGIPPILPTLYIHSKKGCS